jgi:hypothetical protein
MEEVKMFKRFEIGNYYMIIDNHERIEIKIEVIENREDKLVVFRNLENDFDEFIWIHCDLKFSGNDDIKYILSKLNWKIMFKKNESWSDNSKFSEKVYVELEEMISRLNTRKAPRDAPREINFYNIKYKSLSE